MTSLAALQPRAAGAWLRVVAWRDADLLRSRYARSSLLDRLGTRRLERLGHSVLTSGVGAARVPRPCGGQLWRGSLRSLLAGELAAWAIDCPRMLDRGIGGSRRRLVFGSAGAGSGDPRVRAGRGWVSIRSFLATRPAVSVWSAPLPGSGVSIRSFLATRPAGCGLFRGFVTGG
jgi:hypothetical protein